MHDRDIVHLGMCLTQSALHTVNMTNIDIPLDIKPENILLNYHHANRDIFVTRVQLSDLENAAYFPKPRCVKGMLPGNSNRRSPEGHFKGELNKPSDMYSFGLVVSANLVLEILNQPSPNDYLLTKHMQCIYTLLSLPIFSPDDDFAHHASDGVLPTLIRLQRQISYIGTKEGTNGLMRHVGDEEENCGILRMLWEERGVYYVPFDQWVDVDVDEEFRDSMRGLMDLDRGKRITARKALGHE